MKLTRISCSFIVTLISFFAYSQKQRIHFNSINSGGIIIGKTASYGLFQTVNGITYKKWFGGLGAGYDYHYYTSIPAFVDVRRFLDRKGNIFIYSDLGYNFPGKEKPGNEITSYTSYYFSRGLYSDLGFGYKITISKSNHFILTGGYSNKKLSYKTEAVSCPFVGPCYENIYHYNYSFGRIIFKAGIQF